MVAPQDKNAIGNAYGRIGVDISQLIAAKDNAVRAGREISKALKSIGPATEQGTRQAESGLQRLNRQLDTIASKGSLAFGTFIAGGVKSAQSVGQLETKFRILVGSQKQANVEADKLRGYAEATNQPYLKVLETASMLQTAIKGTKVDLQDITSIASRLSIKSPEQGPVGAGIALQEFISGDYMSLVRRFELDRSKLQKIRQEANGDVQKMVEGLDEYLATMGLTNDALEEMGELNPFGLIRDDLQQTMAVGFMPFLKDFVLPASKGIRELLQGLREFNPELLKAATTLAAIAATGAALKGGIPMLGVPGIKGAKSLGILGAAGYAGIQGGTAIARLLAENGIGGDPALKNRSQEGAMGVIGERFKQVIGLIMIGIAELAKGFVQANAQLDMFREGLSGVLSKISGTLQFWIAETLNWIDSLPGLQAPKTSESRLNELRAQRDAPIVESSRISEILDTQRNNIDNINEFTIGALEAIGAIEKVDESFKSFLDKAKAGIDGMFTQEPPDFSQEQIDAFAEFQDTLKEIEAQAQEEREDALEQHEKAKTELQEEYDRRLARMQEDEDLRRTRAVQSRDKAISEALGRSADKESDIYESHRDKLADLEGDFRVDQEKNLEEHQRKMSRMQRDHEDEIRKAASRLDFQAVWQMRERQKTQAKDAEDDFQYRQQQRKEQYDEALAQEQEALAERLAANREAEQARIDQIKQSFVESEALQAENRAIQLQRMQEDHQLQLAKMDEQHAERLQQIDEQAKERADLENQAFVDLFNQLAIDAGQHEDRLLGIHRRGQQQIERELTAWWSRQNRLLNLGSRGVTAGPSGDGRMGGYQQPDPIYSNSGLNSQLSVISNRNNATRTSFLGTTANKVTNSLKDAIFKTQQMTNTYQLLSNMSQSNTIGSRSIGGEIRRTGAYQLEAGEGVLRRDVWQQAKRMMGGEMTQHGALAAMGGGRGGNATFGDINVDIGDVGQHSLPDIAKMVEQGVEMGVLKIFRGYAAG